jgi:hypothetical protein
MPSIRDSLSWALSVVEAGVENVLPKYFPPTPKPCYDDKWVLVPRVDVNNFPAETVTLDDKWVFVPRADVELLPI